MNLGSNPISQSLVPSQKHTEKNFPNPREFSLTNWAFDVNKAQELNWRPGTYQQSDYNFFTNTEPHKGLQTAQYMQLTGDEPIYGHTKFYLNPLEQEQTNAHAFAYQMQKRTRVADSMNPIPVMKAPPYRYPVNVWLNSYTGSLNKPRYN